MATSKSFTALGNGNVLQAPAGSAFTYDVSGTFSATWVLEQSRRETEGWTQLATGTAAAAGVVQVEKANRYRFRCAAFTSGTMVCAIEPTQGAAAQAGEVPGVLVGEAVFVETTGAGVYTGAIPLPAGATILDVLVHAEALWTAASAATLKVGDATDDDGIYVGVNLKATDLLAGESLSFAQSGGKAGADNIGTNTHWGRRYSSSPRVISGIVTTTGATGAAGRTRLQVLYTLAPAGQVVLASKV